MQETDLQRALWNALKADPVPLAVPDVLNGLQRGMVTAYTTTPIYATASQWFTQTKGWTDSNHIYQPAAVVFDKKWWDGLDQELKDKINSFSADLQKSARADVRGIDPELMEEFRAGGIAVHTLSAAEREAMQAATAGVVEELISKKVFERELYDRVVAALADLRAKKGG
jgi:TRAP-type C4-dicarboxylate transport system substrate-binding protein